MRKLLHLTPTLARILVGLVFTVFGLNFFVHLLPQPPEPPAANAFLGALMASGYLMTLVKVVEVVTGLLLLSGRFVPLALVLLGPVLVNIVGFHAALAPAGLPLGLVLSALWGGLVWHHRAAYAPLFVARRPTVEALRSAPHRSAA